MGHHRARPPRLRRVMGIAIVAVVAVLAAAGLSGTVIAAGSAPAAGAVDTPTEGSSDVPSPEVTGPVAGTPWSISPGDYAERGYTQQEFFLHGTARAYLNDGAWGDDGRWNARVNPDAAAPYTTRILVRRPADPARFNGTVLVEWMNVSAGFDVEPDYVWTRDELIRRGYAYVGVSAQAVGVNAMKANNPTRYEPLAHPGDAFSYDMFSQAAMAALEPADGGPQPLGDLTGDVERVLADGESQSGGRLITYVNSVHPLVRLFDGFLIHSAAGGAALSQPSAAGAPTTPSIPGGDVPRPVTRIRTDRQEPVLLFNTETDVVPFSNLGPSGIHEQPDAASLRIWEVTGTAHVDTELVGNLDCGGAPVNDGPQTYALSAAVRHLDRWVDSGRPAPRGPRISVTDGVIDRDPATGLAKGGIRLPDVAVPTRTLSGSRPPGAGGGNLFCFLAGARDPWNGDADPWDGQADLDPSPTPEPVLSERYASHEDYVRRVTVAALLSTLRGHVLPQDVAAIVQTARDAEVP
jgi:hypothetical protein